MSLYTQLTPVDGMPARIPAQRSGIYLKISKSKQFLRASTRRLRTQQAREYAADPLYENGQMRKEVEGLLR